MRQLHVLRTSERVVLEKYFNSNLLYTKSAEDFDWRFVILDGQQKIENERCKMPQLKGL